MLDGMIKELCTCFVFLCVSLWLCYVTIDMIFRTASLAFEQTDNYIYKLNTTEITFPAWEMPCSKLKHTLEMVIHCYIYRFIFDCKKLNTYYYNGSGVYTPFNLFLYNSLFVILTYCLTLQNTYFWPCNWNYCEVHSTVKIINETAEL